MQKVTFRFTFESDWRSAPLAFWVHIPMSEPPHTWMPIAPAEVLHKGFPTLRVELGQHELRFSSPAQLMHCIEVLSTTPLPTTRQLSVKRGTRAGPDGHWLSRLPAKLKSPRKRAQVVEVLRNVYAETVQDGTSFKLPTAVF